MINITQEQIMQNWSVKNAENPLVSIRCITYNHEPYIAQALDGFLMQKTNFPFEIIVHDDASTDNTATIIREYEKKYPLIIKAIYETENQYSKKDGSLGRIMNAATKGKYIAFCEGDDYWIDENKLQMQVDFLEANSDYGLCYTQVKYYYQTTDSFDPNEYSKEIVDYKDLLKNGNSITTLTVFIKSELLFKYSMDEEIQLASRNWLMGDYPLWIFCTYHSKPKFFPNVTSVYRVLEESASHFKSNIKNILFRKNVLDIIEFFCKKYNFNESNFKDKDSILIGYCRISLLNSYDKETADYLINLINKQKKISKKDKIWKIFVYNKFTYYSLYIFIKFYLAIKNRYIHKNENLVL